MARNLSIAHPSGSIDTRALLPMLRAEAAEMGVTHLAHIAAVNALATVRWLAETWCEDAGPHDRRHPALAAAQDPASPAWRLADTQVALSGACDCYRATTGADGLALARQVIERDYGSVVADYALKPLLAVAAANVELAALGFDINALIDAAELTAPPPPPVPTPAQLQAGAGALANWALSDPRICGLADRLRALQEAQQADAGEAHGRMTAPALAAVCAALQAAADQDVEPERMQGTLDLWARATGGPRIVVSAAPG